jgi:hypothetical protein
MTFLQMRTTWIAAPSTLFLNAIKGLCRSATDRINAT